MKNNYEPRTKRMKKFTTKEIDRILSHVKAAYQADLYETFDNDVPPPAKDRYYEFIGRLKSYLETSTPETIGETER